MNCIFRSKRSQSLFPGKTSVDGPPVGRSSPQKGLLNRSLDTAAIRAARSQLKSPGANRLNKSFDGTIEEHARGIPVLGSPKAGRKGSVTPSPGQVGSPKTQRKRSQTPNPTATSPVSSRKGSSTPVPRPNCVSPNPSQANLSPRKSSLVVTELKAGRRSLPARPGTRVNGNLSSSSEDLTTSGNNVDKVAKRETPKRPMSAKERGRSSVVSPGPYGSMRRERSRSRDRTWSENNNNSLSTSRSRSVGPQELSRQLLNKTAPAGSLQYKRPPQGEEVLSVRRDDSGRHSVTPVSTANHRNTDDTKRPMTPRVQITPDRLLPDKPKILRSQSSESSASESVNGGISPNAVNGNNNNERNPKLSITSQSLSFSNTVDLEQIEAPPENKALNEKMERLFAEYLRLEKGLDDVTDNSRVYSPPPRRRNMSNSSEDSASVSSYSGSARTGSSFQKSCSSSREDIISSGTQSRRDSPNLSNRTSPSPSGRASPIPNGGSPRKSLSQTLNGSTTPRQTPATKHSITPRTPGQPGTPRTARKPLSTTNSNDCKPSSRPGTPTAGRSSSLTRQNAIAGSRTSSTSSTTSSAAAPARRTSTSSSASSSSSHRPITPRPITPRQRTVSRGEEVLLVQRDDSGQHCVTQVLSADSKPRERGRTPVRATPGAAGPTARARSRSRDVMGDNARRGREMSATPTPSASTRPSRDQCRTPTPTSTTTRSSTTREGRARTPTTARVRSASMPRPINTASNNVTKTVPSPREPVGRSREAWAESPRGRSGARTPVPQATQARATTPARPASARGQPYHQRSQSQEDMLDSDTPRGRGTAANTRPSSAQPAVSTDRRKSKDDTDSGGCFVVQSDAPEDRRSRSRTTTNTSRQRSASTTVLHRKRLNEDKAAQTSPPKDILPGQLALDLKLIESRMSPKPRKDDRMGRTRIPMPNHQRIQKSDSAAPLKRFDSGVDIATISPTESSIHGDEAWQNDVLCPKSAGDGRYSNGYSNTMDNNATYSNGYSNTMENNISYGLSYNSNQDDDAEYF